VTPVARRRRILFVQYTNPAGYPSLEHASQLLSDGGWEVRFLGAGAEGAATLELEPYPRVSARQMPYHAPGPAQKLHYAAWLAWVTVTVGTWRPDWVYASDPLSAPAALVAGHLGAAIVYHEHDSPAAVAVAPRRGLQRYLTSARLRVARGAAVCVVPNAERAELLAREAGRTNPPLVVWNCPTLREVGPAREPLSPGPITLAYHGSIVPARLPLAVVEALAQLPGAVRLRVTGYETAGHRGYTEQLRRRAAELGVADRLELTGALPTRGGLLAAARTADIALSLLIEEGADVNMAHMAGASNKPFDYMAAGLPFLVSEGDDWRRMFVEPGYACACDPRDPAAIAAAVGRLQDEPQRLRAMGEAGRQKILSAWNFETAFAPVAAALEARR